MDIRAQSVLACSDMHLSDDKPGLTDAFLNWLHCHAAEPADKPTVLLILGDAFDVWVGDDALADAPPSSSGVALATALRSITDCGIRVLMMHGNRDFLLGRAFAQHAGCELLGDAARLIVEDGPVIAITHGDLLCTRDTGYLEFRKMVRTIDWQKAFLAKSLQERIAIAKSLREKSKTEAAMKPEDIVDVTISECEAMVKAFDAQALLHGHTHRPGHFIMANGMQRWVLPDWAIDEATGEMIRGGGLWIDKKGATSL